LLRAIRKEVRYACPLEIKTKPISII